MASSDATNDQYQPDSPLTDAQLARLSQLPERVRDVVDRAFTRPFALDAYLKKALDSVHEAPQLKAKVS